MESVKKRIKLIDVSRRLSKSAEEKIEFVTGEMCEQTKVTDITFDSRNNIVVTFENKAVRIFGNLPFEYLEMPDRK